MASSTCEVRDENIIRICPAIWATTALVLSQRLGACVVTRRSWKSISRSPTSVSDLLGQARNFLTYAAELEGQGDEDTLAFGRDERQFHNVLLVEQPNGSFADTLARPVLYGCLERSAV